MICITVGVVIHHYWGGFKSELFPGPVLFEASPTFISCEQRLLLSVMSR